MRFVKSLLISFFAFLPTVALAEYNTIDEIARAYSDESCKTCHEKIHREWSESFHSKSVVHTIGGARNFIVTGIRKEWNREVTKADLMKCYHCHAPQLYDASEDLIKRVADLVVTAVDEADTAKKEAARKELSKLSVNCIICHNTVVHRPSPGWLGRPEKDAMYGPKKVSAPHKTVQSAMIRSAVFCGQCHGTYIPPDNDVLMCNTLYESYLNAYVPHGGLKTCQDCHMREKNRGHTFPGSYVADIIKEALDFEASVEGYKLFVGGKWTPGITAAVVIFNKAGHRTPDG